jgi:hypothetical protein
MPAELFRAKSRIHDKTYASHYMRYWFEEHEGMPVEPPPPPLSGKRPFATPKLDASPLDILKMHALLILHVPFFYSARHVHD